MAEDGKKQWPELEGTLVGELLEVMDRGDFYHGPQWRPPEEGEEVVGEMVAYEKALLTLKKRYQERRTGIHSRLTNSRNEVLLAEEIAALNREATLCTAGIECLSNLLEISFRSRLRLEEDGCMAIYADYKLVWKPPRTQEITVMVVPF